MDANISFHASPDAGLLAPLDRPAPATLGPAPKIGFEKHLHETLASPKRSDPPPVKPADAETFSGEADDGSTATATAAASRKSPQNESEAPAESDSPPDEHRQEKDPAAVAAAPPTEAPPAPADERGSATEEAPSREIEQTPVAKAAPAQAAPPSPPDREDATDEANSEPPRVEKADAPSKKRADGRVARQAAKDAGSQNDGDAGHPATANAVAEASLPPEQSTDAASGDVRSVKPPRLKPEFAAHDFAADAPGRDGAGAEAEQIAESDPESVRAQASARETAQGSNVAAADRVRLVQRVARAIESARPDGEVRLRIRPPELGSVHLRMKVEDGALVARIETETAHARSLLTEHLPELRERLAELDIRVERFEVEWREEPGGRGDSSPQRDSPRREAPLSPAAHTNRGGGEAPEPPTAPKLMRRTHSGDLDVLV